MADSCRRPQSYVKPGVAITVFELLMMSGVSLETCWAIKKYWNNKFYYTVASCWLFLYELYNDARIHEHQLYNSHSKVSNKHWTQLCTTVSQKAYNRQKPVLGPSSEPVFLFPNGLHKVALGQDAVCPICLMEAVQTVLPCGSSFMAFPNVDRSVMLR